MKILRCIILPLVFHYAFSSKEFLIGKVREILTKKCGALEQQPIESMKVCVTEFINPPNMTFSESCSKPTCTHCIWRYHFRREIGSIKFFDTESLKKAHIVDENDQCWELSSNVTEGHKFYVILNSDNNKKVKWKVGSLEYVISTEALERTYEFPPNNKCIKQKKSYGDKTYKTKYYWHVDNLNFTESCSNHEYCSWNYYINADAPLCIQFEDSDFRENSNLTCLSEENGSITFLTTDKTHASINWQIKEDYCDQPSTTSRTTATISPRVTEVPPVNSNLSLSGIDDKLSSFKSELNLIKRQRRKLSKANANRKINQYMSLWRGSVQRKRNISTKNRRRFGSEIASQLELMIQSIDIKQGQRYKSSNEFFEMEVRSQRSLRNLDHVTYSPESSVVSVEIPVRGVIIPFPSSSAAIRKRRSSGDDDAASTAVAGNLGLIFYRSDEFFVSDRSVSNVVSIDVGREVHALQDPIRISHLDTNATRGERSNPDDRFKLSKTMLICAYWDYNKTEWSTEGSCLNSTYSSTPVCQYTHLSSFAMIIKNEDVPNDLSLSTASLLGLMFSILCLIITIIIHLLNRKAMKIRYTKIFLNVCGNLLVCYLLFMVGFTQTDDHNSCLALTILSHYFFLATWFWKAAYAYEIHQSFVKVFYETKPKYLQRLAAFAYLTPLIIVSITLAVAFSIPAHLNTSEEKLCGETGVVESSFTKGRYLAENVCWLGGEALYFSFLLPVGLIMTFNIILLSKIVVELMKNNEGSSVSAKREESQHAAICVTLATSVGVSWTFGFLLLLSDDETYYLAMSWMFTITTAFQGFFIFFFAVARRKNLWEPVFKRLTSAPGSIFKVEYSSQSNETALKHNSKST